MKIKKGDIVKIINPEIFIRCGYPYSKQQSIKEMNKLNINSNISDILKEKLNIDYIYDYNHDIDKIIENFAVIWLKKNKFGGNKRQIFNELNDKFLNKIYIVSEIKTVTEGIYSNGYSCSFDNEYEPARLEKQKRTQILTLEQVIEDYEYYPINSDNQIRIQKNFVEKLENQECQNNYNCLYSYFKQ